MKRHVVLAVILFMLLLAGCSSDSSTSFEEDITGSDEARKAAYEARCQEKFGLSAEDEWLASIPEGSSLDSLVCYDLSMYMRDMLAFFANCVESKYSASANRFNVRTLSERGYNNLWANVTDCKYKYESEDNYASLVTRDREWYFDECLCKQENGETYYRAPKRDASSSSVNSSSSSGSSSSGTSSSSSGTPKSSSSFVYNPELEVVDIGGQLWSTKNLDVEVKGSMCYNDSAKYCEKYGRMYTWAMAMGLDTAYDNKNLGSIELPYRGICPEGWYLPSDEEWEDLEYYLEQYPEYKAYFTNQIGGGYDYQGFYRSENEETLFWSSSEYLSYDAYAWVWAFRKDLSIVNDNAHKYTGAYIRCLKEGSKVTWTSSESQSSSSNVPASSSSSAPVSSSSSVESSSSNSVYRPDVDEVLIDNKVWMTRNLNVPVEGSMCYNDSAENCEKYGRMYTWAMAMGLDTAYDNKNLGSIELPYRGICPEGWYLPSDEEWEDLEYYLEQYPEYKAYFTNQIGGGYDYQGFYRSEDVETLFWSSSEYLSYDAYAWVWAFRKNLTIVNDNAHKITGAYVRCIKNTVQE